MTPDTTTVYDVTSVLKSGTQTLTVNGSTFSGTVSGTSNGKNYWLFGMNRNGSLNQGSALIMYSTKLYKDGVMVRDFVPARRNSDNELGMYDTVSGQFFTNAGTGDFVAGNPVSDPVEIYTDGTVETIADSANHTATVATLLGVGDYKDEQNINTGAITRKVGIKVLDGTEDWNYSSNTFHWDIGPTGIAPNAQTLCTSYAYGTFGNFTMSGGNSWRLQLRDNRFTTKQELTSWLADQYNAGTPVIVIYPLVTETTESVTGQTMTTAPVRQVSGSLATTIRTMLTNGQELITESISSGIKIATTKYTEEAFAGLVTTLNEAIDKVTNIVNDTVQQATEIGVLAETKQDRPETDCPAGRKCLLIMGADNKPHWYLIQEQKVQSAKFK